MDGPSTIVRSLMVHFEASFGGSKHLDHLDSDKVKTRQEVYRGFSYSVIILSTPVKSLDDYLNEFK